MRHRHRLRRDVTRVPVILVTRVQDETQISSVEGTNHRAAIDRAPDLFETLRELDVVDGGVDLRKRAQHVFDANARRKRRVALRIERFGLRHAAGHPQYDDGVGRWRLRWRLKRQRRRTPDQGRERPARRGTHEATTGQATVDELFFAGHVWHFFYLRWGPPPPRAPR